jgi:hypothetical protein
VNPASEHRQDRLHHRLVKGRQLHRSRMPDVGDSSPRLQPNVRP